MDNWKARQETYLGASHLTAELVKEHLIEAHYEERDAQALVLFLKVN